MLVIATVAEAEPPARSEPPLSVTCQSRTAGAEPAGRSVRALPADRLVRDCWRAGRFDSGRRLALGDSVVGGTSGTVGPVGAAISAAISDCSTSGLSVATASPALTVSRPPMVAREVAVSAMVRCTL